LPNVYVFKRKERQLNRSEIHLKKQCLFTRIRINSIRRRYGKTIELTTLMQHFLISEANRRKEESDFAKEMEEKRLRIAAQEERMLHESDVGTAKGISSGNANTASNNAVSSGLDSIVEEEKRIKKDKEEQQFDEEGNLIIPQRHRPRVVVMVQGQLPPNISDEMNSTYRLTITDW
jgi:hypothetical protein